MCYSFTLDLDIVFFYNACAMIKKVSNKIKAFVKGDESNGRIKWSLYGRVWREIGQPYWKWLAAGIVFTILAAGAEAYTITIVQQVVDKAFIEKSMNAIYWLGIQVIVAFGAKGAFTYAKALIMSKGGLLASANLQKKIYRHMTHMNLARFYADGIGKNLNYFGVQAVLHSFVNTPFDIGADVLLCASNVPGADVLGTCDYDSNGYYYA